MASIDLNGEWRVRQVDGDIDIPAQVPGVVHLDLMREQLIDDPYRDENELAYRWIGMADWEYRRTFSVSEDDLACEAVHLICDGLDTVAAISINGKPVAETDNAFRRYRFDVKELLIAGDNDIVIRFQSPAVYAKQRAESHPYAIPFSLFMNGEPHANHIRKSQTHFGWDWGPCMLATGIWRPIRIDAFDGSGIDSLSVHQTHLDTGDVTLDVTVHLTAAASSDNVTIQAAIADVLETVACACVAGENTIPLSLTVPNPARWWPNGYGDQPLYDLTVTATGSNGETDSMTKRIGFRTLELVREADDIGESFFFRVNGVPVYAKGANWIPADSFDPRITRARLANLLTSAKDANMNIMRVWGGGIYEHDDFYDLCDELGLMVWQDFMFACSGYPADKPFLANVAAEVRGQIRRVMSHPCIALWCGNNEIEQIRIHRTDYDGYQQHVADYVKLFIDTIGEIVAEEDPARAFWPSSASNGMHRWGNAQDPNRGDVHYWAVWHGGRPFSDYLDVKPRFSSEFGFQSFPSLETLKPVLPEGDDNPTSPNMTFRQRSPRSGNKAIIEHTAMHFRMPSGFDNFIYVSQCLQAKAITTAVEHWRRIMPHCMGAIYWQINDIWQGPSWSSLEFDGRWKVLHYAAKRFFRQLLISGVERDGEMEIWLTNDDPVSHNGKLTVNVWEWSGEKVRTWDVDARIGASKSATVWNLPLANILGDAAPRDRLLDFTFKPVDGEPEKNVYFLTPLKDVALEKAAISVSVEKTDTATAAVTVTSPVFAPYTWLNTPIPGVFDDNAFLLFPNVPKIVTFTAWGDAPDIDALRDSITVKSLRDSY